METESQPTNCYDPIADQVAVDALTRLLALFQELHLSAAQEHEVIASYLGLRYGSQLTYRILS